MAPQLKLPEKLAYYRQTDDTVHDIRTNRQLAAEQLQREEYVYFAEWFELMVQAQVELGMDWRHAPAWTAEALLLPYLQQMVN